MLPKSDRSFRSVKQAQNAGFDNAVSGESRARTALLPSAYTKRDEAML
jgi:hypothetical protein